MDIQQLKALQTERIEIFCCYAREDQTLLRRLIVQLTPLMQQGLATLWADTDIAAGMPWEKAIHEHLSTAQIILLLISPDFMASYYCYEVEMKKAMERQESGEARVIPIILRPVDWQLAPFGKFQVLPRDGKPVIGPGWYNEDEAFAEVAKGIHKAIKELRQDETPSPLAPPGKRKIYPRPALATTFVIALLLAIIVFQYHAGNINPTPSSQIHPTSTAITASPVNTPSLTPTKGITPLPLTVNATPNALPTALPFTSLGFSSMVTVAQAMHIYRQALQGPPSSVIQPDSSWEDVSPAGGGNCGNNSAGPYQISAPPSNHYTVCVTPDSMALTTGNFAVQADVSIQAGESAGLAFGYTPNRDLLNFAFNRIQDGLGPANNVYLGVKDHSTAFWKCVDPDSATVSFTTPSACNQTSSAIHTESGQINEITVIVFNEDIYLYLNKTPIMAVSHIFIANNPPLSIFGRIGIVAKSGAAWGTDVICSALRIWHF